ncbi:riboflavin biosynthesis protein RibF [Pseudopedobacter saltans DSM 12145]|uniref:Riboflavin biosynthesis protein n=1 Tax=Pseudopedobacter saltans (strain ATCC 51119 / DSM 12145 / JCM 21818 / CCUG 39354 / LMG 10337 / NBRC 100064 / NCIMB 13643) TaxID=762903 RepID=F0SEG4_PSESL|nr:bifunctional riboflavin kinase/FAD synthetase [Pseudopedobacter saltans]ADY50829.1 riboflavin biosynthesis protein RibF [Pseudopedobacter saltans DSM 12145]
MKIYNHIDEFIPIENATVTIGTFDGVHIGHQKIISQLKEEAKRINGETVILTFFPHPRMILHPEDHSLKLITTMPEKAELLKQLGVDHLIITPFTRDFSNLSPEEYIKNILVDKIGTKSIVIGYDHRFGKDRSGGLPELQTYAKTYGYQVTEIPEQDINEITISSTKIREALKNGDVHHANEFLGHAFQLNGKVIKGDQIGRTLGYPTANLFIEEEYKLIPSDGIYAVEVFVDSSVKNKNQEIINPYGTENTSGNNKFLGMAYIGHRPTINGMSQNIEVNIFDFNEDIYHSRIKLVFWHFIRHDIKFSSLDELKNQLANDKIAVLEKFST